jgi:xanthine dehydrogenase YagR molybdenum-binding subunit
MATELKVAWGPRKDNVYLGKSPLRMDGAEKASGAAKYTADTNPKDCLVAKLLTFKGGAGKVKSLDLSDALKVPGVKAVHAFVKVGDDLSWDGALVAAVAAERQEQAEDGVRAIKFAFDPVAHFVDEDDLATATKLHNEQTAEVLKKYPEEVRKLADADKAKLTDDEKKKLDEYQKALNAASRIKPLGENTKGDVAAALKSAAVTHKGYYGIATISHMCLEPHGAAARFDGNKLNVNLSTQNVSGTAGQFAGPLGMDQADVTVTCQYVGGGFGSKFAADEWGVAAAKMSKETGRPVRLMLDRATELKVAGTRPSGFAEVTIAADKDGKIVAWDSHHWGSNGGLKGGTLNLAQYPYVFQFDNVNRKATGLMTNAGPDRAWRAPPHPQLCALTDTAIDDIAAKLGKSAVDVFLANIDKTNEKLQATYTAEIKRAAELIGWSKKWHAHGKGGDGPIKRGLGMAIHTWGGAAHAATCTVRINPDGSVESLAGTQDIGTGTRTCIAQVLAETFGIGLDAVKVRYGSSVYPRSGPSGGSTTIGGVTGPNRRAALAALGKLFDVVAEKHKVDGNKLAVKDSKIWADGKEVCTWKAACGLLGMMGIETTGEGPKNDGLTSAQVGGVQMADVSVDTETGIVRINQFVAVQDCGMIINEQLAKSQVYGGMIMGIAYSLTEEQILDNKTGRYINADLENYKLPRIGDIGELIVEMYQPDSEYERGVIGLGEPPVIACGAAISNAVANATGVRVPTIPLTPKRVLDALKAAKA